MLPNSHTHKLTAPSAAAPATPPRARGAPKKLPKREGPILATVTVLREEYTSVEYGIHRVFGIFGVWPSYTRKGGICIPDPPSQMEYGIHVLMEYIAFMYYVFSM